MKKKISVISLILLFFISTVGLPFVINVCDMSDDSQQESDEMNSKVAANQNDTHSVSIIKEDCCKTEIIDKSISDQYLKIDTKNNSYQNIITLITQSFSEYNNTLSNSYKYFSDSSPPAPINNHIYLSNSILLI